MELLNNKEIDALSKAKIETVQKKKLEYRLLGTFQRTKGLSIFSYSQLQSRVEKITIQYSKQVEIIPDENGKLTWFDPESQRVNIDSKNVYFEALNLKSAQERVNKFKAGKIKQLENLKPPAKNTIELW
jgi:uncharacterized protein YkwD